MANPQRRAYRNTHLSSSIVPVENALLATATKLELEADKPDNESAASILNILAGELRDLAEELHWWLPSLGSTDTDRSRRYFTWSVTERSAS